MLRKLEKHASDCINETNVLLEMLNSANSNVNGVPDENAKETDTANANIDQSPPQNEPKDNNISEMNQPKSDNLELENSSAMTNFVLNSEPAKMFPDASFASNEAFGGESQSLNTNTFDLFSFQSANTPTTSAEETFNAITETVPIHSTAAQTEKVVPSVPTENEKTISSSETITTETYSTLPTTEEIKEAPSTSKVRDVKNKLQKLAADLKLVDEVQRILNGIKSGNHNVNKRHVLDTSRACPENTPLFELNMKIVTPLPYQSRKISALGKLFKYKQEVEKCRKKRLAEKAKKINALGKIFQLKKQQNDSQRNKRHKKHKQIAKERFLG